VGSTDDWEPKNFDEHYSGPMRLRTALTKSKNMVSIRIIKKITPQYAQDYVTKFGFARKDIPAVMSMALGAGSTTPWAMANGYAVFANGGYRVTPHIIAKITDSEDNVIEEMRYPLAHKDAPKVIDNRNAFLMTSIMRDVVQKGTATKAKTLGRKDLAGKTGTTNNQFDAWFAGYNPKQVAIAWIGFDQPHSLGKDETGGKAALPIWIHYMETALNGMPEMPYKKPDGVVELKVDPNNGGLVDDYDYGIFEYFYHENPPPRHHAYVPPIDEPAFEDIPEGAIDNEQSPLHPQPPDIAPRNNEPEKDNVTKRQDRQERTASEERKPKVEAKAEQQIDASTAAARALNPSGY
jgi:penicillin-binding protein 1A